MSSIQWLRDMIQFLMEAVSRLFAPSDDIYPATGMLPYEDDPHVGSPWDDD